MKRISLANFCATILMLLSLGVMLSWWLHLPIFLNLIAAYTIMVFNTALCFFITGTAIFLMIQLPNYYRLTGGAAGAIILAIALPTLVQHIYQINLGVDEFFAQAWLSDSNPYPGRMAGNTNIGMILIASVFLSVPFLKNNLIAAIAQGAMFFIALLGFTGLIGYAVNIEYLYSWYSYRHMAALTAFAFLLAGIGLAAWWKNTTEFTNYFERNEDRKIFVITLIILFYMGLLSGLLGFVVSANQSQNVITESMQQLLQDKTNWLRNSLQQAYTEINDIVNDEDIHKIIRSNQPVQYDKIDDLLIDTSFSSIKIYNAQDKLVYSSGKWMETIENPIPLTNKEIQSYLFVKDNMLVLQATINIPEGNKSGKIALEWDFKSLGMMFANLDILQKESYLVCGLSAFEKFTCTPALMAEDGRNSHFTASGMEELNRLIRNNQSGMFSGADYSHENIMIAYRPLDYLNIGIVLKKNLDMIYYPMKKNLMLILPFLFLVLLIAAFILYRQVLPIMNELLNAKIHMNDMNIRLNSIINNMDEGIIVTNQHGRIEDINPKAVEIFGAQREKILGENIRNLIQSKERENIIDMSGKGALELTALHSNGKSIPIEFAITDMVIDEKKSYIAIMSDITEKKLFEAKLKESEEKFRSAFNSSAIGMAIVNKKGEFKQVNDAVCKILGYTNEELLASTFQSIIISQDLADAEAKRAALLDKSIESFVAEERYHHKNGRTIWLKLTYSVIHPAANQPLYFVVQIQDISEQKKSEQELAYQAYYDALTGLANRIQLEHHVNSLITSSKRYHDRFAIIFMDLDKFKMINDIHGHQMGDEVLMTVSERLLNAVRKSDLVGRLGGDEFVIIVTSITTDGALAQLADKIIKSIGEPIKIKDKDFNISASLGISIYPEDGKDYNTLLKKADKALYLSKENGRNQYQFAGQESLFSD